MHACIHTCMLTYLHTYIFTYLHTYLLTYLLACLLTFLPTYLPTYVHNYIHAYVRTYGHTYMPACLPTYIHTYIPTYTHTKTHIYIYSIIWIYIDTYSYNTYMYMYRNGESHGFWGLQVRETPLKDSMNHNVSVISGASQDWVMHVWKPRRQLSPGCIFRARRRRLEMMFDSMFDSLTPKSCNIPYCWLCAHVSRLNAIPDWSKGYSGQLCLWVQSAGWRFVRANQTWEKLGTVSLGWVCS